MESVDPNGGAKWKSKGNEPCWKQVGISPAVIRREQAVKATAETQIQAACDDPSLTDRQRKDKIRRIGVMAHQELAPLFTPEQRIQMQTCEAEKRRERPPVAVSERPVSKDPCIALNRKNSAPAESKAPPTSNPAAEQPAEKKASEPLK